MKKTFSLLFLLLIVSGCTSHSFTSPFSVHKIQSDNKSLNFAQLINHLSDKKAVFVSEQHTRMDHHLTQLEILKAMRQRNPNIGIGVEWFQQSFQSVLNDFIDGKIDEAEMLRETEYYKRWKYDYRLYKPVMDYARKHQLPVIALNAPAEITAKVGRRGIDSLTPAERQQLPAKINPPSAEYREQLLTVFQDHEMSEERTNNFIKVQRIWDESMAANSARFLEKNPAYQMVVFAGVGHIGHDSGIPNDFKRRLPDYKTARVVSLDPDTKAEDHAWKAEYFVQSREVKLPESGKMGVMLSENNHQLMIDSINEDSAASKAKLQKGDIIVAINQAIIRDMTDLKLQIGSKPPNEEVKLLISRSGKEMPFTVRLQ